MIATTGGFVPPEKTDSCESAELDSLLEDVDLLSDATKDKIREIRKRICDVTTLRNLIEAQESRARRDMDKMLKSLRDLRNTRRAANGRDS